MQQLAVAVAQPETNILAVDGTIKRFEFTWEVFWKTLKRLLDDQGMIVTSPTPKEILRKAYAVGWLQNETLWLDMQEDRNRTAHIYSEAMATGIYKRIKTYQPEMQRTYDSLMRQFGP